MVLYSEKHQFLSGIATKSNTIRRLGGHQGSNHRLWSVCGRAKRRLVNYNPSKGLINPRDSAVNPKILVLNPKVLMLNPKVLAAYPRVYNPRQISPPTHLLFIATRPLTKQQKNRHPVIRRLGASFRKNIIIAFYVLNASLLQIDL